MEAFAEIPLEEIMSSLFEGVDFEANGDAGFLTDDDLDANEDEAEDDDFAPQDTARDVSARCPTCGTTWDRLKTDGRAGCSGCYAAFRTELNDVMTRLQRGGQHLGKTPKAAGKRRRRLDHLRQRRDHQLQLLQNRLKEAVASEQYEEAATLRDKIKIVSSTIVSS